MFFQKEKTQTSNQKKPSKIISFRNLQQDKIAYAPNFAVEKYSFRIRMKKIVSQSKSLLKQASIFFNDHFHLLIKSAAENHLRIQQCKIKPIAGEACNLTFGSYTELKKYQKKVRLFTFSTSSTMASVLIAILVVQVFFPGSKSQGATFTFNQAGWNTASTDKATHLSNQNGWDKFESKDANLAVVSGGADLELAAVANTKTQTDDTTASTGFNLSDANNSNTVVSGTSANASVKITPIVEQINTWDTVLRSISSPSGSGSSFVMSGDDMYFTQGGGTTGFFKYSFANNAWTTLSTSPGGISDGSSIIHNVSEDEIYVTGGNSSTFYKYSISANSWTALADAPGTVNYGSRMIRNGSDDAIYVTRSNGYNTFYKYSISANSWTTMAAAPGSIYQGHSMIHNSGENDIYVTQGNSGTGFYKYSISGNSWTTLAVTPAITNSQPGRNMIRNGADDDIYITQGGGTGFYKYSISGNSWTTLAVTPASISFFGSTTIRIGSGDNIYVTQGGGNVGFYKYSISGNAWTALTATPAGASMGGFMMSRNEDVNDIYLITPVSTTTGFYKYSITGNSWIGSNTNNITAMPGAAGFGGAMLRNGSDNEVYVLAGNGTGFYRYSIAGNSWTTLPVTPGTVGAGGGMIRNDGENYIYVAQGGNGTGFYRYSISGNSWTTLTAMPATTANVTSPMIRNDGEDEIYVRGVSTNFYKYSISGNSWTTLTAVPGAVGWGGFMIRNGADNDIYVTQGNNVTGFYKYSISGNSWTTLAVTPGSIFWGSSMIRNGGDNEIYLTQGNNVGFYKYSISGNSWTALVASPAGVGHGSAMLRNGADNNIYLTQGNAAAGFYRYSISGNSWTTLTATLGNVGAGGNMIRNGSDNEIYIMQGSSTTGFYKFIINSVTYDPSGTYTSGVIDLGLKTINFGNLNWNNSLGQTISLRIRTGASPSEVAAASWGVTTTVSDTPLSSLGANNGDRYLQYEATLSTSLNTQTPSLDDITFAYNNYPASQSLLSSAYNTSSFANSLAKIGWTEILPANTDVRFQMRTAPDSAGDPAWATGSGWCGPTTCAATTNDTDYANDFYQTTPVGESSNEAQKSGNDDQWVQYRATLVSDGQYTPTLSDTTLTYAVNANPEIQNIVSTQGTDNKVTTTFEVRDPDTTTGATNGNILGGLQYCTANCATPGSETWTSASSLTFKNASNNTLPNNTLAIEEVNYTPYTIVWDPKIDYPGQYHTNLKVRITSNDSEAANAMGYGSAVVDIFDTKNPTNVSVVIDHTKTTNNLTLTTPADDSTYQAAYSNYSDFRDITDLDYTAFPIDNQKSYDNLTQDPATVYVRVKDAKGNYTDATSTTPAKPNHVVYYDTSNSLSSEYREFVAWDVIAENQFGAGFESYKVYRADRLESDPTANLSYSLLATINDRNTNFYTDLNLSNSNHYYYKIVATDVSGNTSQYSSVVEDNPNGQGGSDQTPPTISGVTVSSINTTSATISWTTDELADSAVGYSEGVSYLPERGLASMTTSHEITLTGLTPDKVYNLRVKSRDPVGNLAENDKDNPGASSIPSFSFTTLPGPAISNVTIPYVSNTQATIEWKTTTDSSSFIVYSDTVSSGALIDPKEFGTPDLVGSPVGGKYVHSQTITTYNDLPLVPNTTYYFYVKSVDGENNTAIDNNGGSFYELVTTEDSNPPTLSNITVPISSYDRVAINWTTDEPATSMVSYKKSSATAYTDSSEVLTYDRGHYIILSNLEADTTYDFKVVSRDINTNSSTSDPQEFVTTKNIEFQHDPLAAITFAETNPSILSDIVSVISFNTDQNANCLVEYGTQAGDYSSVPAKEGKDLFNKGHNIQLNGLIFLTKYFYKVTCQDNLETIVSSDEKDFTTKEQYFTAAGAGALGDHIPPVITNVNVASVTGESATITWDTDEKTSSSVRYGADSNYGITFGDDLINSKSENYITAHSVVITGLIPATKYIFRATSLDASGNISESAESSFTTASPSSLSSIKVESKNLGEATITWKTGENTTSTVEYGLTTSYGEKKESNTLTQEHSISLSNLNQGTTYHYRVKGKDKEGRLFASADNTFEPKSPAQITDITINDITEHGATVTFKTNVPTDAQVIYTDLKDNQSTGAQGIRELTTEHKIMLTNLNQGTTFGISISVKDEQGTEATAKGQDFTTGQDEQAPKIENIKTDSALTQSDKVQTIISWKTDEQATTSVLYKEGRNGEEKELKITDNLTTSHIGVITIFKPGTVYNFRVKSIDASGNEAISNDFALLTPRKRENIIQIIIGNFTDIFGWAQF